MPTGWTALFIHGPLSASADFARQHGVFNQIKSPDQIPPLYTSAPIYIQMTHELILNLRDLEKKHQLKQRLHGVCMI